jgi:tripartite-type tricarboxylate transporter receptor subunit TctC
MPVLPRRLAFVLCLGLALFHPGTHAQVGFPEKPVRLLVSVPPGGVVDLIARSLAKELATAWG